MNRSLWCAVAVKGKTTMSVFGPYETLDEAQAASARLAEHPDGRGATWHHKPLRLASEVLTR